MKKRRETFYVPKGKKKPMKPTIATVKRDLTALSSVFDYCIGEHWMTSNPVRDWLNPAGQTRAMFWHRPPAGKRKDGKQPKAQRYMSIASNFRRIMAATTKQAQKLAQDFGPSRSTICGTITPSSCSKAAILSTF